MSLFTATLSAAVLLLVFGLLLLWNGPLVGRTARAFPRSQFAAIIFFGGGGLWFLWNINQLGPADFGDYRRYIFMLFAAVGLAAFFVARDFLAVRGVAILILLAARLMLDSSMAYYPPPGTRVWLNAFVYLMIVVALYIGSMPFVSRDFLAWLFQKPARPRALGALCAVYGSWLAVLATSYHNKF